MGSLLWDTLPAASMADSLRPPLRCLEVRLGGGGVEARVRFAPAGPLGAPAEALERLARAPRERVPLTLAVGPCVAAGVPTAARAQIASRAALGGGLAEGQVGSDLAACLVSLADLVVLDGSDADGDAVLVLEDGGARLLRRPAWRGLSAAARNAALAEELGPCATLAAGPAAQAGVPFANLTAGFDPGSRVGRGGLGLALAARGLLALAVVPAAPRPSRAPEAAALEAALRRSPRLRTRAHGGTLELFDRHGADAAVQGERHGCQGCPTPCGVTLEGGAGAARFSALEPLRTRFGAEAEALLARCNELGMDAREAAARLAPGEAPDQLLTEPGPARALAPQPRTDRVGRLAARVSGRGSDPLRAFPFLTEAGPGRLRAVAPELDAVGGGGALAKDPSGPGEGFVVGWHEDLSTALDALGFCAFSAAALLADGVLDLDALARALVPELAADPAPGASLRRWGAALARTAHRARHAWGAPLAVDLPEDLEEALAQYCRWRGLDPAGAVLPEDQALSLRALPLPALETPGPLQGAAARAERAEVRVQARGALGADLAAAGPLELPVPASAASLIEALAARHPDHRAQLLDAQGRVIPALLREGRPLGEEEWIAAGERIELLWVVPGG